MSICGIHRSGVAALALAGALLGGGEAEGAYFRETAPADFESANSDLAGFGRGLEITANEDFSVFAIDVWANIGDDRETEFKIFELDESTSWPGTEVAQVQDTHTTDDDWDWIRFDLDYTFEADTDYILHWYGMGFRLPSVAGSSSEVYSHPEFTGTQGLVENTDNDGEPTDDNDINPRFRLAIPEAPEPSTAVISLSLGCLLMLRRRGR